MHKLCNTMQVTTILNILFKCNTNHFIINLHLSFKIPNVDFTHFLVEDWIEVHFAFLLIMQYFHLYMKSTLKHEYMTHLLTP